MEKNSPHVVSGCVVNDQSSPSLLRFLEPCKVAAMVILWLCPLSHCSNFPTACCPARNRSLSVSSSLLCVCVCVCASKYYCNTEISDTVTHYKNPENEG